MSNPISFNIINFLLMLENCRSIRKQTNLAVSYLQYSRIFSLVFNSSSYFIELFFFFFLFQRVITSMSFKTNNSDYQLNLCSLSPFLQDFSGNLVTNYYNLIIINCLPLSASGFVKEIFLYEWNSIQSNITFCSMHYNICYLIWLNSYGKTCDLIISKRATSSLRDEINGANKINYIILLYFLILASILGAGESSMTISFSVAQSSWQL